MLKRLKAASSTPCSCTFTKTMLVPTLQLLVVITIESARLATSLPSSSNEASILSASITTAVECTSYVLMVDESQELFTHCRNVETVPVEETEVLENTTYLELDGNTLGRSSSFRPDAGPEPGLARLKLLKSLDLSANELSAIGRDTLAMNLQLERLKLSNNWLEQVPRDPLLRLPGLRQLDLSANRIGVLRNDSLAGLRNLTDLNLAANRIWRIESHAFAQLTQLQQLDLSMNRLATLDPRVATSWQSLTTLQLGGNPLQCDCRLLWLRNLLLTAQFAYDSDSMRCETSPVQESRNRSWTDLTAAHFACIPMLLNPQAGTPRSVQATLSQGSASLTCDAVSDPRHTVMWKRDGKQINITGANSGAKYEINSTQLANFSTVLHVRSLKLTDSGSYSCEVSNKAGVVRGEYRLQVVEEVRDEGLSNQRVPQGAQFGSLFISVFCTLIIVLVIISTIVYCWHFRRSPGKNTFCVLKPRTSKAPPSTTTSSSASTTVLAPACRPLLLHITSSYDTGAAVDPLSDNNFTSLTPLAPSPSQFRQIPSDESHSPMVTRTNQRSGRHAVAFARLSVDGEGSYDSSTTRSRKPCPIHGMSSPRSLVPAFPMFTDSHSNSIQEVGAASGVGGVGAGFSDQQVQFSSFRKTIVLSPSQSLSCSVHEAAPLYEQRRHSSLLDDDVSDRDHHHNSVPESAVAPAQSELQHNYYAF